MIEKTKNKEIFVFSICFTLLAFGYLVFDTYNTKQTEHIKYIWIIFTLLSQSLLTTYGFINENKFIFVPSMMIFVGILYILYIKMNYEINNDITNELKRKDIIM
jgi:hypothetical protein